MWCGIDRGLVKKGIIRQATRIGSKDNPPRTPQQVIEDWLALMWEGSMSVAMLNGRSVVSTSEANGSVTFHVPEGGSNLEVMALLEEILADLIADETGVHRIKRMRTCFNVSVP